MPVVDLHSILRPVTGLVADLAFPDLVAIEAPTHTQTATGDPVRSWTPVTDGEHVPALISPVTANEQTISPVVLHITDVKILLAGDRAIGTDYRIRNEAAGQEDEPREPDVWDVIGVQVDEARVLTTVIGRRQDPGTPDEEGEAS